MGFLKKLLVPIIIFAALGAGTILLFDTLPNGNNILLYPLVAELGAVLYFWQYQITKNKRSGIFYIYLTLIVAFVFAFTLLMSFLHANDVIPYSTFLIVFWVVVVISFAVATLLKLIYRGLNDSIKNQSRGEHGLFKMKEIANETMFILDQNKKDASEPIKVLKEVIEALEYSDPVSHKNAYAVEREIVSGLKTARKHAKNKLFNKIKAVMKDSNGVLFLIEKRNRILKDSK